MAGLVEAVRLWLGLVLADPRRAVAAVLGLAMLGETVACVYTYYLPLVVK